jgi:glutathione S-transferase
VLLNLRFTSEVVMIMKLYFAPGACSFVPHCLLEIQSQANGFAYESSMIKLHKGEQKSPDYLAINPRGQVPVLVDGTTVITQIVAICNYIHEKFPTTALLPTDPIEKAKVQSIFAWMNNTVHPAFTHFFMPAKFTSDEAAQSAIKAHAAGQYRELLEELQAMVVDLKHQPWFSGTQLGPVDAYALTLLRWGGFLGVNPETLPVLWTHVQKVAAHPAVAAVIERERLQLNMFTVG